MGLPDPVRGWRVRFTFTIAFVGSFHCTEGLGMAKRFREILGRPINWHVWQSHSLMRIKSIELDCLAVSADRYLWDCIDQRRSFVIAGSSVFLY